MELLASGFSQSEFGRALAPVFVTLINRFMAGAVGGDLLGMDRNRVAAFWNLPPEAWENAVQPGLLNSLADRVPGFGHWYYAVSILGRELENRAVAKGELLGRANGQLFVTLLHACDAASGTPAGSAVGHLLRELKEMCELPTPAIHAKDLLGRMTQALKLLQRNGEQGCDGLLSRVSARYDELVRRGSAASGSYDATFYDGSVARARAAVADASRTFESSTPWMRSLLGAARSAEFANDVSVPHARRNAVHLALQGLEVMSQSDWQPGPAMKKSFAGETVGTPGAAGDTGAGSNPTAEGAMRGNRRPGGCVPGPILYCGPVFPSAPTSSAMFPGANGGSVGRQLSDPFGTPRAAASLSLPRTLATETTEAPYIAALPLATGVSSSSDSALASGPTQPASGQVSASSATVRTTTESIETILSPDDALLNRVLGTSAATLKLFPNDTSARSRYLGNLLDVLDLAPGMPSLQADEAPAREAIRAVFPPDTDIDFDKLVIQNIISVDAKLPESPPGVPSAGGVVSWLKSWFGVQGAVESPLGLTYMVNPDDQETRVVDMFMHIGRMGSFFPPGARVFMDGVEVFSPDPTRSMSQVLVDRANRLDYGALHQQRLRREFAGNLGRHTQYMSALVGALAEEAFATGRITGDTLRELRIGLMPGGHASLLDTFRVRYFDQYEALNLMAWCSKDGQVTVLSPNDPEAPMRQYRSLGQFVVDMKSRIRRPDFQRELALHVDPQQGPALLSELKEAAKGQWTAQLVDESTSGGLDFTLKLEKAAGGETLSASLAELYRRAVMAYARSTYPSLDDKANAEAGQAEADILKLAEEAGINLALMASGPVGLGYQVLDGIFTGWEAWAHHDKRLALRLWVEASMNVLMFVVGEGVGRLVNVGGLATEAKNLIKDCEKVELPNGEMRLWRPDLSPYRSDPGILEGASVEPSGRYEVRGSSYIRMDQEVYEVTAEDNGWALLHPTDKTQYRPKVARDADGKWHRMPAEAEQWEQQHLLGKVSDETADMSGEQRRRILDVTEVSVDALANSGKGVPLPHAVRTEIARVRLWNSLNELSTSPERWSSAPVELKYVTLAKLGREMPSKVVVTDEAGFVRVFGNDDAADSMQFPNGEDPVRVLAENPRPGAHAPDPVTYRRYLEERMSSAIRRDPGRFFDQVWPIIEQGRVTAVAGEVMGRFPELTARGALAVLEGASPEEIQSFLDGENSPVRTRAHDESLAAVVTEKRREIFQRDPRTVVALRAIKTAMERVCPMGQMTSRIEVSVTDGVVSFGPEDATEVRRIRRMDGGGYTAPGVWEPGLSPRQENFYAALMHAAPDTDRLVVFGTLNTSGGPALASRVETAVREDGTIVEDEVATSGEAFENDCAPGRMRRNSPWAHCAVHSTVDPAQRRIARLNALGALHEAKASQRVANEALADAEAAKGRAMEEAEREPDPQKRKAKIKEARRQKPPAALKERVRAAGKAKNDAENRVQRNYVVVSSMAPIQASACVGSIDPVTIRRHGTPATILGDTVVVNSGLDPVEPWFMSAKDRPPVGLDKSAAPGEEVDTRGVPGDDTAGRAQPPGRESPPGQRTHYHYEDKTRMADTEAVFLDVLTESLYEYKDTARAKGLYIRNMNILGHVFMYTELPMCASCFRRYSVFVSEFPNVVIEVGWSFNSPEEREAFNKKYSDMSPAQRDAVRPMLTRVPVRSTAASRRLALSPSVLKRKWAVISAGKVPDTEASGSGG